MVKGREIALQIDNDFRATRYAQHLKDHPRWSRYQPENTPNEEWRRVLYADSDGLDQARLMIGMTHAFLEHDTDNSMQLSDEDKELLLLASAIQNWGKSNGDDISYEFLTESIIEERRQHLHTLFDELMPALDVKRRFILEKTLYDKTTRLGEVFDALRRLNCLRTALIAYEKWTENPVATEHAHLGALSIGVLSNQLTHLVSYAEKFTPVKNALDGSSDAIDAIFADKKIRGHAFVSQQQTVEATERAEMIWSRSHGDKSAPESRPSHRRETLFSPGSLFEKRFIDDKEKLMQMTESLRSLGLRIVLTSGSFDLLHIGHAKYLEKAAEFGDVLIVGVDSDEKIKKRKGPTRPVVNEAERLRLLSHLRGVDLLTLKHPNEEKWGLIKNIMPDTLIVTAETYTADEIRQLEEQYCGRVIVLEPQATTSTGAQIRKIQIGERTTLLADIEQALSNPEVSEELRRSLGQIVTSLKA